MTRIFMDENFPYELLEVLGRGAMGVVHRARQVALNRFVAVKLLEPRRGGVDDAALRMRREGKALSQVRHPNLVQIFDMGVTQGRPFISMELIEGTTLTRWLEDDPWKARHRADELFASILEAVAALHEAGFIHRDLKPDNIMMTSTGRPVVMDLGLVKSVEIATWATAAGSAVGTPAFMAPELLSGVAADPSCDVWSLGCVYYYLSSGQHLFSADSLDRLVTLIVDEPLPDFARECPDMAPHRRILLEELLARDRALRPPDAKSALARLHAVNTSRQRPSSARTARRPAVADEPTKDAWRDWFGVRRRSFLSVAAVLISLLVLSLVPTLRDPPRKTQVFPAPLVTVTPRPRESPRLMVAPSPMPLSWRWRLLDGHKSMLRSTTRLSPIQIDTLRRAVGLSLGTDSARWLTWMDLGRWLETLPQGSPPRLDHAVRTSRSRAETLLTFDLNQLPNRASNNTSCFLFALEALHQLPDLAYGWLILGRYLENESPGSPARFQAAYSRALECPWPEDWGLNGVPVWESLARALVSRGGRALEEQWWGRVPQNFDGVSELIRTSVALKSDPQRWESLLLLVPRGHTVRGQILTELSARQRFRGDIDASLRTLKEGLVDVTTAREVGSSLASVLLMMGDHGAVTALRSSLILQPSELSYLTLCLGEWSEFWSLPGRFGARLPVVNEFYQVHALLDQGRKDEAVRRARVYCGRPTSEPLHRAYIGLWMMGQIGSDPDFESYARAMLLSPANPYWGSTWQQAIGALASPQGQPLLEQLLAALKSTSPANERLVRALWDSRNGHHEQAFAGLEASRSVAPFRELAAIQSEILTRPLWDQRRGLAVAPSILERARDRRVVTAPHPRIVEYRTALLAGDEGTLRKSVRSLMASDGSPFWPAVARWSTLTATGDDGFSALSTRTAWRAAHSPWARTVYGLDSSPAR